MAATPPGIPAEPSPLPTGVILVDHGSRRDESNLMLLQVVKLFEHHFADKYPIVEPAHMELAEPSIPAALAACVRRGARRIVVMPYFLLPGKHWASDIPRITAEAAAPYPGLQFLVTAPLGLHPLMAQVIDARIDHCLAHAGGNAPACDVCAAKGHCGLRCTPAA